MDNSQIRSLEKMSAGVRYAKSLIKGFSCSQSRMGKGLNFANKKTGKQIV